MRYLAVLIVVLSVLAVPSASYALLGAEVAVGGMQMSPTGDFGYKGTTLDLKNDMRYDKETRFGGRAKLDLPILPTVYVMYTPMSFKGDGNMTQNFSFAGQTYNANAPFSSELKLDHYDVALLYSVPFLKTLTLGKLNVEAGLNARIIMFSAKFDQAATNMHQSKSTTIPVPMIYLGAQINPIELISVEGELRGIQYGKNKFMSAIGRLKVKPLGLLGFKAFIAGGYRYDNLKIDVSDIKTDMKFSGPFAEVGVQF